MERIASKLLICHFLGLETRGSRVLISQISQRLAKNGYSFPVAITGIRSKIGSTMGLKTAEMLNAVDSPIDLMEDIEYGNEAVIPSGEIESDIDFSEEEDEELKRMFLDYILEKIENYKSSGDLPKDFHFDASLKDMTMKKLIDFFNQVEELSGGAKVEIVPFGMSKKPQMLEQNVLTKPYISEYPGKVEKNNEALLKSKTNLSQNLSDPTVLKLEKLFEKAFNAKRQKGSSI